MRLLYKIVFCHTGVWGQCSSSYTTTDCINEFWKKLSSVDISSRCLSKNILISRKRKFEFILKKSFLSISKYIHIEGKEGFLSSLWKYLFLPFRKYRHFKGNYVFLKSLWKNRFFEITLKKSFFVHKSETIIILDKKKLFL